MIIQWKERYNIGYKDIDLQHRKLLDIVNDLYLLIESSPTYSAEKARPFLLRLVKYATIHFKYEERHMEKCNYYMKNEHIKQHQAFVKKIIEVNNTVLDSDEEVLIDMLGFLKNWYINHIMGDDNLYKYKFKQFFKTAETKAIIFDYGNVIESFDNDKFLEFLSTKSSKDVAELRAMIYLKSTLVEDFETGKISSERFYVDICKLTEAKVSKVEFINGFSEIFTPIKPVMELIKKLKPNYILGLISNTNEIHFQNVIKKNVVFPLFDAISLSNEVGVYKPDWQIFLDILKKVDLVEEECIIIDDQLSNIKTAKDSYFKTVHFRSPEQLTMILKSLKVRGI